MDTRALQSVDEALEEITRILRSLPARPGIEEVEAAKALISNMEREDQVSLELIGKQIKGPDVPEELFMVIQEMQKNLVYFQSKEQRREALKLLEPRERSCFVYPESIQMPLSFDGVSVPRASINKSPANASSSLYYSEKNPVQSSELFSRDDSFVKKTKSSFYTDGIGVGHGVSTSPQILDSTLKSTPTSGQDGDKLSLIKLASLLEVSANKGTRDLNLQGKLMDQINWLPDSIGKLSNLVSLNLSENRMCPCHPLSEAFQPLVRLEELDLSANRLSALPESIGLLVSLKRLIVETNDIEEIPHTIGQCLSLKELCADYNRLKALPEAVGKIESLEVLSVRYNNIKQLPTTMASLSNMRELDISFNELESIPESLCFATTLAKINVGNNFADLRSLPRSIGNLEMLEELDISNNQIRVLPDSFRMLTHLRVLRVEENPLEVPPRHIAEMGAQAVVQYMVELVEKRDVKSQPIKQKKSWAQMCFFQSLTKGSAMVLTM
ncbi:plant intracellular Ras-group-related LRR protein 4 [Tripterygium wilfordii]|uniref:Plant intracellular Ras-group-related LRR protein 4 n=1 Tax=Tripterygium wilfordii TaxID=458696 RepID=A0A7J7CP57_TRIWF|nr:plant intracellular Ras-group-related LRR protein 4 [Tripterygium wilfordii]